MKELFGFCGVFGGFWRGGRGVVPVEFDVAAGGDVYVEALVRLLVIKLITRTLPSQTAERLT